MGLGPRIPHAGQSFSLYDVHQAGSLDRRMFMASFVCSVVIRHLKQNEITIPHLISRAATEKPGVAEIHCPSVDVFPRQSNIKGLTSFDKRSTWAGSGPTNILRPYHTRLQRDPTEEAIVGQQTYDPIAPGIFIQWVTRGQVVNVNPAKVEANN